MRMKLLAVLAAGAVAAGCASYDGRSLVPGKSVAADVEALMGPPAERLTVAGESVWFYPRNPGGLHTYAVRFAPDGTVRAVEQRLTEDNLRHLVAGVSTKREVRELLGPPMQVIRMERQQRDVWGYRMYNAVQVEHELYVQFSNDGLVREVLLLRDYRNEVGDHRP